MGGFRQRPDHAMAERAGSRDPGRTGAPFGGGSRDQCRHDLINFI
jgi:hypothetical protein